MKFVSWNVNGLRACIQKGFLEQFNELDADFFCLQETKLSEGQLKLDLPGYEQYWCYAEKKGYSGTAIFTKHTPLSVSYGIDVPDLDNEGRVITLEYQEFYLVTCYTPNAQRGLARLDHRMKWDEAFRDYLKKLDAVKPVVLCGDLNVAHKEIDLKNPASNRGNAGFSDEERESFQKTLDLGFTDTFRHLNPDTTGKYSWWSYMYHARENNAGWRIDYFLVSDRLQGDIYRADIHSDIMGSDHCPVSLDLHTLINGSLWSPSVPGKASVIEPEGKKTKPRKESEPKAFAHNAKALVAFFLLFILVMGGGTIFGQHLGLLSPQQDTPSGDSLLFRVETNYLPMQKANRPYSDGYVSIIADDKWYYVNASDYSGVRPVENANIWFRVELTDEGRSRADAGWSLITLCKSPAVSVETDLASFSADVACIKYYSDPDQTDFQGWLIWGKSTGGNTVNICFTDADHQEQHNQTVTFSPYLTQQEADLKSTMELVRCVLEHEDIYNDLVDKYVPDLDPAFASCYEYPIFTELLTRTDVLIEALMNGDYGTDGWLNYSILSLPGISSQMTAQQEADFLTGNYENCPIEHLEADIEIPETATTETLVSMLYKVDLSMLSMGSTKEVRGLVYEIYSQHYSFLQELETRDDAATVLMDKTTFPSGDDDFGPLSFLPYCLLEQDVYRNKMYPEQDAQFALLQFGAFSGNDLYQIEYFDIDTEGLPTMELLYALEPHITRLSECNSTASMYYAYKNLLEYIPDLEELMNREDLLSVLKPLSVHHKDTGDEIIYGVVVGYSNIFDDLIELREYLDERELVPTLTTAELVQYILDDTDLCNSLQYLHEWDIYTLDQQRVFAQNHPAFDELGSRSDSVYELMNREPRDQDFTTHYLLGYYCIRQWMTPRQEADYLTSQYPSFPFKYEYEPNTNETVEKQMSTSALLEAIAQHTDTLTVLDEFSSTESMFYGYQYWKDYKLYLKEFMNRPDTVDVLSAAGQDAIYKRLIDLRYYMEDYEAATGMSTEELVNFILTDSRLQERLSQSAYGIDWDFAAIRILINRDDAIQVLMNNAHSDNALSYTIVQLLLENYLYSEMTAKEQAQFITNSYSSAWTPFQFSLNCDEDVQTMTTQDLILYILNHDINLGNYLLSVDYYSGSQPDTRIEIYRLLREHSNVLLELETREDALEELEKACNDSTSYRTSIPVLYELWPEITA